jgi:alcohol dehydrogenase (cytochrome c)
VRKRSLDQFGRLLKFVSLLGLAIAVFGCSRSAPKLPENPEIVSRDLDEASSSKEWLTYGHAYDNQRYVTIDDITPRNVGTLTAKFIVQTGQAAPIEATPIVSRGVMYVSTWNDVVLAINARTGERLWQYTPVLLPTQLCCGAVSRGVALMDGLVFVAQLDDRLVALSQFTGRVVWSTTVASRERNYSMTLAPVAYHDKVYVGVSGGDLGIRGFIRAYSAFTGKLLWTWYSTSSTHWLGSFAVKEPCGHGLHRNIRAERAAVPYLRNSWRLGGGAVWTTPAIDPSTNEIIATVGNPFPDIGEPRPGDNLYTASIVAIDADSGLLRWYFQEVPHDLWDFDPASPPMIIPLPQPGGITERAVAEAGKTGWVYIISEATGKLVRCSEPFVPQKNIFSTRGTHYPRGGGGANWSPASFDPSAHLLLVMGAGREKVALSPIMGYTGLTLRHATSHRFVTFSAIDVTTGKIQWQRRLSRGSVGGSTSTSSGLTFFGDSDGYLNAVDTRTGRLLWQFQTGAAVNATPVLYEYDGKEYVVVASAGNKQAGTHLGDAILAFGLP